MMMSVFLVSYKHLNTVINWAAIHIMHMPTCEELDKMGREMWAQNYMSYYTRYPNEDMTNHLCEIYRYTPARPEISAIEFIKLADCIAYQCDESKSWEQSKSKDHLDTWRKRALQLCPEYDKAEWSIT
jgi:hypothetical protein